MEMIGKGKVVFVGMSGGVDSSVAAALLKAKGYDVIGIHLRCWNVDGCAEQDAEDARRAAEVLDIPFYVLDFEKEYKKRVVNYMVDGYRRGITPNPDVECNREIKFGLVLERALSMGADYMATGHYIRLHEIKNQKSKIKNYVLATARDSNKDQSYFLWTLTQKQLRHCLFPIGDYTKPQVRAMARKFGLPNAEKKDSQGICFLGRVKLGDFLGDYIKPKAGHVKLVLGDGSYRTIGEHHGAHFYTIGQRHGIGVGGRAPLYVAEKDVKTNTLVVAEENNPALYRNEIKLTNVNFVDQQPTTNNPQRVYVRVRYRQPLAKADLQLTTNNLQQKNAKLTFAKPQKAVAPGQSAVFYSKSGEMLGGGVIA